MICSIDWTAAAAWVQAVGSVGAIIAATIIARSQARSARQLVEDERLRQVGIASQLLASRFFDAEIECGELIQNFSGLLASMGQSKTYTFGAGERVYGQFHLTSVEPLLAQQASLMLFPKDSAVVAGRAMDALSRYNRITLRFVRNTETVKWDAAETAKFFNRMLDELRKARSLASEAYLILAD